MSLERKANFEVLKATVEEERERVAGEREKERGMKAVKEKKSKKKKKIEKSRIHPVHRKHFHIAHHV